MHTWIPELINEDEPRDYHPRVEQSVGRRLHVGLVDPVVPDLRLRGLAYLLAGEHAEPHALSAAKQGEGQ